MKRQVIITNGSGGCGKDTFAQILGETVSVYKYSSIDLIKEMATKYLGYTGGKTEKDRKFLSDLKYLAKAYNNTPFEDVKSIIRDFINGEIDTCLLVVDIRESDEIAIAKKEFNAVAVLIVNPNITRITSNEADSGVMNYKYDFIIENDGTMEDLRNKAKRFLDEIMEADKWEENQ